MGLTGFLALNFTFNLKKIMKIKFYEYLKYYGNLFLILKNLYWTKISY